MKNGLKLIRSENAYEDYNSINPYKIELFRDNLNNDYLVRTTSPKGSIISQIRTKNHSYGWELMYKIEYRYTGYKSANLELLESRR